MMQYKVIVAYPTPEGWEDRLLGKYGTEAKAREAIKRHAGSGPLYGREYYVNGDFIDWE